MRISGELGAAATLARLVDDRERDLADSNRGDVLLAWPGVRSQKVGRAVGASLVSWTVCMALLGARSCFHPSTDPMKPSEMPTPRFVSVSLGCSLC